MTRDVEATTTMDTGREMDWLVESALYTPTLMLDEDDKPDPLRWRRNTGEAINAFTMPHYSSDMAAAWVAVAEVQRRNPGWRFGLLGGDTTNPFTVPTWPDKVLGGFFGWQASFFGHEDAAQATGQRHGEAFAPTPELAICCAIVRALAVQPPVDPLLQRLLDDRAALAPACR